MIGILLGVLTSVVTTIFLYSDIQELVFGSDAFYYLNIRDMILGGDILLLASGIQVAPIYSWFLSVIASIFGSEITWIYLSQIALTTLTAFLVYRLAYKADGSGPARLALLGFALYLPLWIVGLEIHPQMVFLFILILAMILLLKAMDTGKARFYAMAGLAAGLAVLTRSVAIYLPFVLLAVLLFKHPRNWTKHLIFILTFAAVLMPWTVRNSVNLEGPLSTGSYAIVNQLEEIKIPAQLLNTFTDDDLKINWNGLAKSFAYPYRLSFVYAYGGTAPAYHYGNILNSPDLAALAKFISQPKIISTFMLYFAHVSLITLFLFYVLNLSKRFKKTDTKEIIIFVSFIYFAASILFVPSACDICYSYYLVPALPFMLILAAIGLNNVLSPRNASKN